MEKYHKLERGLRDASWRRRMRVKAKAVHPPFPTNGCAAWVSACLLECGFSGAGGRPELGAEELADKLQAAGWKRIPVDQARDADVFVTVDDNNNGRADHIGFTIGKPYVDPGDKRWKFRCCDNRIGEFGGRFYVRNVLRRPGGFTPVAFFLRAPGRPAAD